MGILGKFSKKQKIGLGVGAGLLGVAGALGAKKLFGKRGMISGRRGRKSTVAKLRSRVQKLTLKIKEKQLKRKLFKEELRV